MPTLPTATWNVALLLKALSRGHPKHTCPQQDHDQELSAGGRVSRVSATWRIAPWVMSSRCQLCQAAVKYLKHFAARTPGPGDGTIGLWRLARKTHSYCCNSSIDTSIQYSQYSEKAINAFPCWKHISTTGGLISKDIWNSWSINGGLGGQKSHNVIMRTLRHCPRCTLGTPPVVQDGMGCEAADWSRISSKNEYW